MSDKLNKDRLPARVGGSHRPEGEARSQAIKRSKQRFTATTWQEEGWWIAQALELDIASQGETEEEALDNLVEALELHFEPPTATILPNIHTLEIELAST